MKSTSQVKPDSQSLASNGQDLSAVNEKKPGEKIYLNIFHERQKSRVSVLIKEQITSPMRYLL